MARTKTPLPHAYFVGLGQEMIHKNPRKWSWSLLRLSLSPECSPDSDTSLHPHLHNAILTETAPSLAGGPYSDFSTVCTCEMGTS